MSWRASDHHPFRTCKGPTHQMASPNKDKRQATTLQYYTEQTDSEREWLLRIKGIMCTCTPAGFIAGTYTRITVVLLNTRPLSSAGSQISVQSVACRDCKRSHPPPLVHWSYSSRKKHVRKKSKGRFSKKVGPDKIGLSCKRHTESIK